MRKSEGGGPDGCEGGWGAKDKVLGKRVSRWDFVASSRLSMEANSSKETGGWTKIQVLVQRYLFQEI